MNSTLTRKMIEEQQRNAQIRAAFIRQYPDLADQVHEGAVDLAHCTCPLCRHIRASLATSVQDTEAAPDSPSSDDARWYVITDITTGIGYRTALITPDEAEQRNRQLELWGSSMEWQSRDAQAHGYR